MKCICPKCEHTFFQKNNTKSILKFIKENPDCSLTDLHYDIRISLKNILMNIRKLEQDGLVTRKDNKIRLVLDE